ncbi:MAG: hypothetical protein JWO42_3917 [Chloroflexi bacterium]|jgi:uncharacterized membrane protein YedE/YeeE|nr:hypothetical protein [Chloroflexota bacterium]
MNRLHVFSLLFGTAFGFLFSAAGFNQYNVIHRMLLLHYLDPFLVMGAAVAVALPLIWLLERRHWQTPLGGPFAPRRWPAERKHVLGGAVFGVGWAVTGACPGTVTAMIGTGSLLGIVTLAGVLFGIALRDAVHDTVADPLQAPRHDAPADVVMAGR